jgi:hypothetical protein
MPFISSVRGSYGPQGRFGRALGLSLSTGGTITTAGGYRIHTFTTVGSSTFEIGGSGTVEYLVVAGGGGGGVWVGSGAGAGGMRSGSLVVTPQTTTITVGAGGNGTRDEGGSGSGPYVNAEKGGDSTFLTVTSNGGGVGGSYGNSLSSSFSNGGSGGGAMENAGSQFSQSGSIWQGGTGINGQGYPGGNYNPVAPPSGSQYVGAGGGGASQAGGFADLGGSVNYSSTLRKGGDGLSSSISGSATVYAGGGGGGCNSWNGNTPTTSGLQCSNGGSGGGGAGWTFTTSPSNTSGASIDRYNTATNGTNGLGGGGGGVGWSGPGGKHRAGNGGSGIVIVRYPI